MQTAYRPYPSPGGTPYTTESPRNLLPTSGDADYALVSGSTNGLQGTGISTTAPTTGQVLTFNGTLWTPQAATSYTAGNGLTLSGGQFRVAVPLVLSGSSSNAILSATNTGSGQGIYASSATNHGLYAVNTNFGNAGSVGDASGIGVFGASTTNSGVKGTNGANGSIGTLGDLSGYGVGGFGTSGQGVYGTSASNSGVQGTNTTNGNFGTLGDANGNGVSGTNTAQNDYGALGDVNGFGVYGNSKSNTGVYGINTTNDNYGSLGDAGGYGVNGYSASTYGVYGSSDSSVGVYGTSNSGVGVAGINGNNGNYGSLGDPGAGIYGTSGSGPGIYAQGGGTGVNHPALYATNTNSNGIGIYSVTTSADANLVVANSGGGDLMKAYNGGNLNFEVTSGGNLNIPGTLTAGVKHFRIDDPIDPAGKFLSHASIESDEMTDIYSGNILLGEDGSAWVQMPQWFQALNKDFRYVVTCHWRLCAGLCRAGDHRQQVPDRRRQAGMKISWQVTGGAA